MSMVVKNNINAVHTLNTLNQNSTALSKSLAKVSSGMKINSAQDDASAYAISERMRVQLRSLDQAQQNTQNDMAMMRVAEGAVTSTLEIVKTLKEKAIDAANDSNTDEDRKTIQKEVDQFIDQVDDNALVTFNGKHLLLGDSSSLYTHEMDRKESILRGLNSAWIGDALSLIEETYGVTFEQPGNRYNELDIVFAETQADCTDANGTDHSSATAWMGPNEKGHLQLTINIADGTAGCINTINSRDENGSVNDTTTTDENGNTVNVSGGYLDRVISHEFTHGIMQSMLKEGVMANLPSWVKEGGTAEMTHGADERDLVSAASNPFDGDAYAGGFVAMRFLAKSIGNSPQDTMKKMMRGLIASDNLDGALQYVSGGAFNEQGFKDMYNAALAKYNGDTTAFLKEACGINQNNNDTGSATGWDAGNRVVKTNYNVLPQASRPVNWSLPGSTTTAIKGLVINWPKGYAAGTTGGSLNFHTGAGANQSIHVGLFDMRARSIGLIDQEGNKLNVSTIGNANQSIGLLDKIANVVLDEATNIGSIEARLEYTSSNLTTASENVQSAESTIRDADMAKEMTEYTKNNVLLQASQSMLAQANQSASNVLSLLQ